MEWAPLFLMFLECVLLPPSQNKCNFRTEHVNQCQMQIIKLSLVFCKKNLDIGLSFVQEVFRDSCILWLLDQNYIFCETNFEPQNCIYFRTDGVPRNFIGNYFIGNWLSAREGATYIFRANRNHFAPLLTRRRMLQVIRYILGLMHALTVSQP